MKKVLFLLAALILISCKPEKREKLSPLVSSENLPIKYAKGFSIEKSSSGLTLIKLTSPWPNAETSFTYALVPKEIAPFTTLNKEAYDAIITVPVERVIVTSTTHIPALEALGALDKLVGFPNTSFISSKKARQLIDRGQIKELGNNEALNTEMIITLNPDLVVGFGIDNQNKTYKTLQKSNISVVYNGEWVEETPLGKAEWIKFFAPFFEAEIKADSIFNSIEKAYDEAKKLAQKVTKKPTVLSGGLYKDVWYAAGGKSWVAQFLNDAHCDYLYKDAAATGSLSLSLESVLNKGYKADFWLNPSLHVSYNELIAANEHYKQFDAYKNKKVYTNVSVKGETGGLLFYELAPQRPDLVLKDLIHIFHPELLPEYQNVFFKPLE